MWHLLLALYFTLYPPSLPECDIRAYVGHDFTQVDVGWPDSPYVTEYAYPTQWQAAQKIGDIETEFACSVRWERV